MERSRSDVWVGLFVLIGAVAILFLALQSANLLSLSFQPTYQVSALFDNIGGLKRQAAVKSAGVVVGRVGKISFNPQDYEAVVELDINSDYKFPTDTSASIMTSGLLGEQYVALEAGADEKMLAQGDTLKITQGAVVLENLIGQFLYGKTNGSKPAESTK